MNLNQYLEEKINKWKDVLNNGYKTDSGKEVCDFAKGSMMAYLEVLNYIKKYEK